MICIVPLAGPDLVHSEHAFRPLAPIGGRPLIEAALEGRSWRRSGYLEDNDYVFVLRSVENVDALARFLLARWPGSKIITLGSLTSGALYSALAGVALARPDERMIVDLADILFEGGEEVAGDWSPEIGAMVPCFLSSESCYSYLREVDGRVVEAAEKVVISNKASAGVYTFRDPAVFLSAAAHSIANRERLSYKSALFVCPVVNGVLDRGLEVAAPIVDNVRPIGKMFHT